MSPDEIVLWGIAALMAVVTAFLIREGSRARTALAGGVVLFLLGMMASMVAGALVYFLRPGTTSLLEALWISSLGMLLSAAPLLWSLVRGADGPPADAPSGAADRRPGYWAIAIGLVLANELLMGWAFPLALGPMSAGGAGTTDALGGLSGVVNSSWFVFTMALEMGLTTLLLRDRLPRPMVVLVGFQTAIMALSPTALSDPLWHAVGICAGSALMIAAIVFVMEHIYRHRELNAPFARYAVRVMAVYAVMMAGLFLWLVYGIASVFALSIVAEMVLYFAAALGPERFASEDRIAWQLDPRWAFELLSSIFVAEVFMGALLDAQLQPESFLPMVPAQPLAGPAFVVVQHALSNGFFFLAAVTGSTWFLAMMGAEMGALVVFKLRETRERETKVRLVVMIGSYAAFAVFFPSLYYAQLFPNLPAGADVPFLGWSMGIGTTALAPVVFTVVFVTYALTGVLSGLFGRRAICSTFCTAALMYQGTAIDAMKSFNRSSPVGRKYLSSRLSGAYQATNGVVMGSLVVASLASYLDATGRLDLTIGGTDPTVFLFALYFGVLWYVMFAAIPYVGTYSCVTMGWCYTGTIAQAFQRVGFFKLKVKDRQVCWECTTFDCAKSCPVGLTDMPGHFRQTGEFRSSKCCGVGNCVGACPYGNLYISDVRHWIADRLGRPIVPPTRNLPMVSGRSVRGASTGPAAAVSAVGSIGEAVSAASPDRAA